jgi:hypothetical protein
MPVNEKGRASQPMRIPPFALAVALLLTCLASCWFGVVAGRPFVLAKAMRAENEKIETRIADQRMELQGMKKNVAALNTDSGMEIEARKLGYVKQGESQLLIPTK